jgi:hypothetical protein
MMAAFWMRFSVQAARSPIAQKHDIEGLVMAGER